MGNVGNPLENTNIHNERVVGFSFVKWYGQNKTCSLIFMLHRYCNYIWFIFTNWKSSCTSTNWQKLPRIHDDPNIELGLHIYVLSSLWRSKIGYFPDEILKYRSLWHSNATMYQLKIWERSPRVIKIGIEPFSPFYRISCEVCLSLWVFDRDSLSHKKRNCYPPFYGQYLEVLKRGEIMQ